MKKLFKKKSRKNFYDARQIYAATNYVSPFENCPTIPKINPSRFPISNTDSYYESSDGENTKTMRTSQKSSLKKPKVSEIKEKIIVKPDSNSAEIIASKPNHKNKETNKQEKHNSKPKKLSRAPSVISEVSTQEGMFDKLLSGLNLGGLLGRGKGESNKMDIASLLPLLMMGTGAASGNGGPLGALANLAGGSGGPLGALANLAGGSGGALGALANLAGGSGGPLGALANLAGGSGGALGALANLAGKGGNGTDNLASFLNGGVENKNGMLDSLLTGLAGGQAQGINNPNQRIQQFKKLG